VHRVHGYVQFSHHSSLIAQLSMKKSLRLPTAVSWLLVIGGIAALLWGFPGVPLSSGGSVRFVVDSIIPSAAIVLGMVSLDRSGHIREVSPLAYLGDASYSIYLSHIFLLGALRVVWAKFGLEHSSAIYAVAFAVASMIIAIIGGAVTYRYLETPMLRVLQGLYRRRRASANLDPAFEKAG
jgi:exopolysaccharide production protein ExoZ